MFYELLDGRFRPQKLEQADFHSPSSYLCITDFDRLPAIGAALGIAPRALSEMEQAGAARFESRIGFDLICLHRLEDDDVTKPPQRICIYFRERLMFVVCEQPEAAEHIVFSQDSAFDAAHTGLGGFLCALFAALTRSDAERLEQMEDEITALEDALITTAKQDCVREIISLRRRLLALKRHYEQLLDILDGIQDNDNGILPERCMRFFKIYDGRVGRLYQSVCNLRDYVTQVRESYQAAVDISLNSIMKFFTVITAIFLPLSLVAGWYGMNFEGMPEYHWAFGYPVVIAVSVIVVTVCIVYFKKNKWF